MNGHKKGTLPRGMLTVALALFLSMSGNEAWILRGQDNANAADDDGEKISLIHTRIQDALLDYEDLTNFRVITTFADLEETISIDTRGEVTKTEAIEHIEKSLLLNGWVFVPSGPKTVKLLKSTNSPRTEGVPIISSADALPETDQLVTYVMPFTHVPAEEALAAFSSVAPNHTYGQITVLPDGMTLAITENTAVIRKYIGLQQFVDVEAEEQEHKTITLERAKATEVVEQLTELLDLESSGTSGGRSSSAVRSSNSGAPQGENPAGSRRTGAPNPGAQVGNGAGGQRIARDPKVIAIDRTNSIMIMAHPVQLSFIEGLIQEFDAPATVRTYLTVRLAYMPVIDFLSIARDAIARGEEAGQGGTQQGNNTSRTGTTTTTNNTSPTSNTGFGGSDAFGGSSSGLGSGFSGSGTRGASLNSPEVQSAQSLLVGETLLIADPASNELFVSGPPEHLEAIEQLIEHVDKRPRQVFLSTVIGQLTLGNNVNVGLDIVREADQFEIGNELATMAGVLRSRAVGGDSQGIIDAQTLTDVASFIPAAQGFTFYGKYGDHLNAFVDLLETSSRFKVLQRPSVFATNNKKSTIEIGQQVPVPTSTLTSLSTGTANPSVTSNIQFRDVVLGLEVVPLINSDDEVTLTISQTNNNITGTTNIGGNDVPNISTQSLVTEVIVPNKATVLLGGLISEDKRESKAGIPKLIHIPLLKHLAGSQADVVNRQELLVFIQPEIVTTGSHMADANYNMLNRTEVVDGEEHIVQPGPVERIVTDGTPYSHAVPVTKAETVFQKRKWPFSKLFKKRK